MAEFLLTKEEMEGAYLETLAPSHVPLAEAIAQAQCRKVAEWIKRNSVKPRGGLQYRVTYWGREEWNALMREAGLEVKEG